jgi:hypothetical protein
VLDEERLLAAAFKHFRDVIEPQLRGETTPASDLTLAEFVEVYLERHAVVVRPRTIRVLYTLAELTAIGKELSPAYQPSDGRRGATSAGLASRGPFAAQAPAAGHE